MSNIPENVLVDNEDRELLETMGKWSISDTGYCVRIDNKNKKQIRMHRIIMNPPDNMVIDHINGNPLDNRRCNLRIVTFQQNHFNRTKAKGYSWHKKNKKWQAQIVINKKTIFLGLFDTEIDAHNAYLSAKEKYHKIK
jgi:hypothetical protein